MARVGVTNMESYIRGVTGVSEHRNYTLLDMVHSMMSLTDLSLSFWGYA